MLFEKLKYETQPYHSALEKVLVKKLRSLEKREDYASLLADFYSYYLPAEEQLKPYVTDMLVPDHASRRKSDYLQRDLEKLGHTQQPAQAAVPPIENQSQAIGCMYVFEGSTLGGQIIAGMLDRKPGGVADCRSFFSGYGPDTAIMWQRFKENIEMHSERLDTEEVLKGAICTFEGMHKWFERIID